MKSYTPEALAAFENGTALTVGAVEIASDPVVRVWGGNGPITFDGRTFQPVGDYGLVRVVSGALGDAAQNITLVLSGIEPEILELLDASEVQRAPTTLWRLIFDALTYTLLDYHVWARGQLDTLPREEKIGGTATIQANLETAAKGLGRRGGRLRSDADQRLIDANDGFFKNVAYAGEKNLYWGGRKPERAGSVLGGGGAGNGANSGGGLREF